MKIIIAAGGTGGHLYPGIAIAREIRKIDSRMEILFTVTKKAMDMRVVMKEGFKCYTLPVKGLLGKSISERMVFPLFLTVSMLLFCFILIQKRPRVIVGTGGYASFVPLFLGVVCGIPTLISEQDSYPGFTTRLLSKFVSEVHIANEKARLSVIAKRLYLTGNPIRDSILEGTRAEAMEYFNLDSEKKTVFILGGSHGARSINSVFVEVMRNYTFPSIQFIFQTGKSDYTWVKESLKDIKVKVRVLPFIERINLAYSAADIAFSRAGALAIAEITARGIPSVLIPFPYATGGHQEENARYLEKIGASVMLLDSELNSEKVTNLLFPLLSDNERLSNMSRAARLVCKRDAAHKIAMRVVSLARGGRDVP